MSKNAASEEKLGDVHNKVADALSTALDGEPILNEEGEEIGRKVDPRIISAAITFCNNNKIQANPFIDEDAQTAIQKKLDGRIKRFKVVPEEAAKRAANDD